MLMVRAGKGAIPPSVGQGNGHRGCKVADMHIEAGEWRCQEGSLAHFFLCYHMMTGGRGSGAACGHS